MRLPLALGLLLLLACADKPAAPSPKDAHDKHAGRMGSHGMVVAGPSSAAFLSHIPMFNGGVHDVQLVTAGRFTTLSATPVPASFSESLHTFVPDKMSLDEFRSGKLASVEGTLFVGNFESGGKELTRARFELARVVHQHVLESKAAQPELTYFVFGSRSHALAVHRIAGAPSFDEVLRVEVLGDAAPTDAELASGLDVRLSGRRDEASARLGLASDARPAAAAGRTFTLKSAVALSCLDGPEFASACK